MSESTMTLRPASYVDPGWSIGAGTGIPDENLADDDLGSFVTPYPHADSPSTLMILTMDAFTLADTDQLRYIRLWLNVQMGFPRVAGDVVDILVKLYSPDDGKRLPDQPIRVTHPGAGLYTLLPYHAWPDGTVLTADDFADGLRVRLQGVLVTAADFEGIEINELGLDVVYNQAPTVNITGEQFGNSHNNVIHVFTYADAEGDLQERYEDRVYELPPGGFPAGTNEEIIAALEAAGREPVFAEERVTDLTTTNGFLESPGLTYQRFIRAADQRSGQRYGLWDNILWAAPAWAQGQSPNRATATVVPDAANARVEFSLGTTGFSDEPEHFEIWRSDDNGLNYHPVINGTEITRTGATTTFYDRFAPRMVEVIYRIRSVIAVASAPWKYTSEWISKSTVLGSDGNSWLQSPDDDTLDLRFDQTGTVFAREHPEQQSVFYAEGRAEPIIFGGTIHLANQQLTASFLSEDAWQLFTQLHELQSTLLLRTLYGEGPLLDYWIKLGSPISEGVTGGYSIIRNGQLRRVSCPAFQVAAPDASA